MTDSAEVTEATESPASKAGKPADSIKMPTKVGPPGSMSEKLENKQTTRIRFTVFKTVFQMLMRMTSPHDDDNDDGSDDGDEEELEDDS